MEDFAPMNKEEDGKEVKDDGKEVKGDKSGLKDNVTPVTDDAEVNEAGVLQCR